MEQIITLKMNARQLERQSERTRKEADKYRKRMVEYIKAGNAEAARIMGADVLRKQHEANDVLRLSARLSDVRARLEMGQVNQSVVKLVGKTTSALSNFMAENQFDQIASTMGQFEKMFDDLAVKEGFMAESLGATAVPQADSVDDLIAQVEAEVTAEVGEQLPATPATASAVAIAAPATAAPIAQAARATA